jgi:predicted Zn finger-like uncharacterized protein
MRLTCPNCGAQYEVDDSVIPDEGRDVQCSGCGQGWFQPGKAALAAAPEPEPVAPPEDWEPEEEAAQDTPAEEDLIGWEEPADAAPEAEAASPPPEPEAEAEPEATPEAEGDPEPEAEPEPTPEPDRPAQAPSAPAAAQTGLAGDAIASAIADLMREEPAPAGADALDAYLEDSDYDSALAAAPLAGTTPRRAVDDEMLAILREEAEREAAQRRAETGALETQGDLGLEATPRIRRPAAASPGPATPEPPKAEPVAEAADRFADLDAEEPEPAPRGRERLPDIEEINSTLTATSDRAPQPAMPAALPDEGSSGGFGGGFLSVIFLAGLGLLAYVFAARLIGLVPALEAPLSAYVAAVDSARIALDQMLQGLIERLSDKG